MKTIGGFFELEMNPYRGELHSSAAALTSGRACLAWILSVVKPTRVYIPDYCCRAVSETLSESGVESCSYGIDANFRPLLDKSPQAEELFLYVNYFGIHTSVVRDLESRWSGRLILDNTQAFFEIPRAGSWAFNSARKFFGVPDGAYLYGASLPSAELPSKSELRWDHLIKRHLGRQDGAYREFLENEALVTAKLYGMSPLSRCLLGGVDYTAVARRRRENFAIFRDELGAWNELEIGCPADAVPFCYPLLLDHELNRTVLARRGIFIPTFWPELIRGKTETGTEFEQALAHRLLPLPVDHRYDSTDCRIVIQAIHELLK